MGVYLPFFFLGWNSPSTAFRNMASPVRYHLSSSEAINAFSQPPMLEASDMRLSSSEYMHTDTASSGEWIFRSLEPDSMSGWSIGDMETAVLLWPPITLASPQTCRVEKDGVRKNRMM